MSAPWPDYPYYLPYPPGQLWAYNYPRLSPSFHDAPMRSVMVSGDGINGSPQSLPVANNFVPTMDLEAHHDAQTHHDAQSVGGSDSSNHEENTQDSLSDAEISRASSRRIDADDNTKLADAINNLSTLTAKLVASTEDDSRAIGEVSVSVDNLSKRIERIESAVEQLAATTNEILECERRVFDKFALLAGRSNRSMSAEVNLRRPSQ